MGANPMGEEGCSQGAAGPNCRHPRHRGYSSTGRCAALPDAGSSVQQQDEAAGLAQSAFDAQHPLPPQPDAQGLLALLAAAAASTAPPSGAWLDGWCAAAAPLLPQLPAAMLVESLQHLANLGHTPPATWMAAALAALRPQLDSLLARQLAAALWALSNVGGAGSSSDSSSSSSSNGDPFLTDALAAAARCWQDCFASEFAQLVCAAGALLEGPPPPGWTQQLLEEAEFQLVEYNGDWGAFECAQLVSGLNSILRLERDAADAAAVAAGAAAADAAAAAASSGGSAVVAQPLSPEPSERLMTYLMKAVYGHTKTMEEKAAVDFALAQLQPGMRSMHYDTRWTHEELKWLPRRERDKRRILKEGWYRSQWGGWQGGGSGS